MPSRVARAVAFVAAGFWIQHIDGYVITSVMNHSADSDPLGKTVIREAGAWMTNFHTYPKLWAAPLLGVLMPLFAVLASRFNKSGLAFLASSLANAGVIATAGIAMFPFVMPSSLDPSHSLTMWDATSSKLTMQIITMVAFVMVPVIVAYTSWTYYKMFGRVDNQYIEQNKTSAY